MATSIVRQSRARRSRRTTEEDPIQQLFEYRAGIVARQEFAPLGRVMQIHTTVGVIDFRNKGPAIGRLADGSPQGVLDLVEPWPGAPSRVEVTPDNCADCLAKCDECARGVRKCNQGRHSCGGSGKVKTGEKACKCVKSRKRPNPGCTNCGGCGSLPLMSRCETCDGSGKVTCRLCQGTAKMSTGRKDGSTERNAPNCTSCQGYGRKLKIEPQPLEPHISRQQEVYVLGPIRGLLIMPILGSGIERMPMWWTATADSKGNHLRLVLRTVEAGSQALLIGGTMIAQNFTAEA